MNKNAQNDQLIIKNNQLIIKNNQLIIKNNHKDSENDPLFYYSFYFP